MSQAPYPPPVPDDRVPDDRVPDDFPVGPDPSSWASPPPPVPPQSPYGYPAYGPGQPQPPGAYGAPYGAPYGSPAGYNPPPNNNLVWAILATLLCCLPLGVVSIVKASTVNTLWAQGQYDAAHRAAASARTWAIASAIAGPVVVMLYFLGVALVMPVSTYSG